MPTVLSFDMGLRNLAWCKVAGDPSVVVPTACRDPRVLGCTVVAWSVVDILEEAGSRARNAKAVPIEQAVRHMMAYLQTLTADGVLSDVDLVAIEQQPCGCGMRSNIRMKVLSHAMQAFFVLQGKSVSFVSPKRKNTLAGNEASTAKKSKDRYAVHKKQAIALAADLIAGPMGSEEHRAFFASISKKDDAADALLQACVVLLDKQQAPKKRKRAAKK